MSCVVEYYPKFVVCNSNAYKSAVTGKKLPDNGILPVRDMSSYPRSGMANKVQNLSENKLKRILEYNARLEEQLKTPRVTISEASKGLIAYCKDTHDPLVPSVWGPVPKSEDPFAPSTQGGCCTTM